MNLFINKLKSKKGIDSGILVLAVVMFPLMLGLLINEGLKIRDSQFNFVKEVIDVSVQLAAKTGKIDSELESYIHQRLSSFYKENEYSLTFAYTEFENTDFDNLETMKIIIPSTGGQLLYVGDIVYIQFKLNVNDNPTVEPLYSRLYKMLPFSSEKDLKDELLYVGHGMVETNGQ